MTVWLELTSPSFKLTTKFQDGNKHLVDWSPTLSKPNKNLTTTTKTPMPDSLPEPHGQQVLLQSGLLLTAGLHPYPRSLLAESTSLQASYHLCLWIHSNFALKSTGFSGTFFFFLAMPSAVKVESPNHWTSKEFPPAPLMRPLAPDLPTHNGPQGT